MTFILCSRFPLIMSDMWCSTTLTIANMKRFVSFQCINNLVFLKQFCFCIALLIIKVYWNCSNLSLCWLFPVSVGFCSRCWFLFRWLRVSVVLEVSRSASVLNFRSWCRSQFPDESPSLYSSTQLENLLKVFKMSHSISILILTGYSLIP